MIKIAPSILSADLSSLKTEVMEVEKAGADLLHIDIMDGHFVPNLTFGPNIVDAIRPHTQLPLDVHLMIDQPDLWIKDFAKSGANMISVHQEACPHLHRTIYSIKELGLKAGVVINPATPVSAITAILPDVDWVLLMTVNPGFGGQSFISQVLFKIRELSYLLKELGLNMDLQVDGGINQETAPQAVTNGANILVAGSAIFQAKNRKQAIIDLKNSIKS